MESQELMNAIFQAKTDGMSDESIMKEFSVGLKDIEQAVISKTGINLNLFKGKSKISTLKPKDFQPETSSVWSFKQRGRWASHNGNYRGNWSPYIPRNVILKYSSLGDTVLDQFCGGGTTVVESKLLGRRGIGRDINPGAVMLSKQNLDFEVHNQELLTEPSALATFYEPDVSLGDARNLSDIDDEKIDLICTHPPYADIVQYSDNIEEDISHLKVDAFLSEMKQVARECARVLKPDGACAILIGDMRKNKRVIPLGFQTIQRFLDSGFVLQDLIIKRQHNCRTTGFWYNSSIKNNFLLLSQEYLPIFVKTKSRSISHTSSNNATINPQLSETSKPSLPVTIQCKTTWVFEKDVWREEMKSNLFNRYGGDGRIATIEMKEGTAADEFPEELDLAFVTLLDEGAESLLQLDSSITALEKLIPKIVNTLRENGHLAIRVRDFRENNLLHCPALKIWKLPLNNFKIREIIIVTTDETAQSEVSEEINISHEYLLIYEKS